MALCGKPLGQINGGNIFCNKESGHPGECGFIHSLFDSPSHIGHTYKVFHYPGIGEGSLKKSGIIIAGELEAHEERERARMKQMLEEAKWEEIGH